MTTNSQDISLTNKIDGTAIPTYSDPIQNAVFQVRRINKSQARFKLVDADDSSRWQIPTEALDYPHDAGSQTDNDFDIITGFLLKKIFTSKTIRYHFCPLMFHNCILTEKVMLSL